MTATTQAPLVGTFPTVRLSAREMRAFALYASGRTMCEVAEDMGVSETTAQTYIKRIRRKYVAAGAHLSNKIEIYRAAQAAGLL
jgi:DNA-binding CsgD family transcriptional regulator